MITSGSNPRIAQLRALHTAKGREASGLFLIEGPHLLEAAIDAHITPRVIIFDPQTMERSVEGRRLLERIKDAQTSGAEALEATPPAIERASDARTPQGVVGAVALADLAAERIRSRRRGRPRPLLLALDALADPGNMGTILRSALAADVDEALLGPDCVDPFAPKVVRAGAGAHFHLPIHHGLRWPEIAERFAGSPVVEQTLVAEASGRVAYDEVDMTRRTALIIGNEAHGVSRQAAALATERISIPMWNKVESLNAAIAASVILFEAARQRRRHERASTHGADGATESD